MEAVYIDPEKAGEPAYGEEMCRRLEEGDILILRDTPFAPSSEAAEFLRSQRQTAGRAHKNISYKPNREAVSGVATSNAEDSGRVKYILAAYSVGALEFLRALLPRYAAWWQVDYASFRPFEEQGRDLPLSRRNDLMHVDAFPTRPTHGGRILRLFTNLHPTQPRVWATASPFEELAAGYAVDAGLLRVSAAGADLRRKGRKLARLVGVNVPDRSPYDEFMLQFHDYLKSRTDFQREGVRDETPFPPGASWISFTDHIAHAARSGQYALEQTCIVPFSAMLLPERAPLSILERIAQRPLVERPVASAAGGASQKVG